ncbi:hypothetical protein H6F77_10380 [Microcoleus sp. FACHB-831]|uniref:hypothetical protein n=1 Tax=Microcoleus sp. FACHB-831 TaxID=2692827 RepID=UPI001688203A|nr:hypothetical protein [Microcoleus sp. FACHB-831]MBD1921497.1 hypothetical protein [Microcoleus sp. FACHB-831]
MRSFKLTAALLVLGATVYSTKADARRAPNHKSSLLKEATSQSPSLVAQNARKCPKDRIPVTVNAPGGQSPSYAGKLNPNVDPGTRCIFFKDVSFDGRLQRSRPRQTWLIIHGWRNDSEDGKTVRLAKEIAKQKPEDRVLILDWGQAAKNEGETNIPVLNVNLGNYYATSWIRPVAEVAVQELRKRGIDNKEASENLNLVGHSLGSMLAAEIGAVYLGLDPKGNRVSNEGVRVNRIIALDPPSELNVDIFANIGGYDVDGRTPAYTAAEGKKPRVLHPEAVDSPKKFRDVSRFSRAFVGSRSVAGNQEFASWAHESFQMEFGGLSDEHGRVVETFIKLISEHPFKQPGSKDSFLDLDDSKEHNDCNGKSNKFIKCDAYNPKHEGSIGVDSSNKPTSVRFRQPGMQAPDEVVVSANGDYTYKIDGIKGNRTVSITSLGGNPKILIDNYIPGNPDSPLFNRSARYLDVKVELGQGQAKITIPETKVTINFTGVGEVISRRENQRWQIAAGSTSAKPGGLIRTGGSDLSSREIPFEICGESKTWVRPTATEQRRHLQNMGRGRYSLEVIGELGGDYWTHNIFSFTSYPGGSGTFDITHLSGFWTPQNPSRPSTCDNAITALNSGKLARVWVLNYRVISIKWLANRYVMVVKPTSRGAQIINFSRRERQDLLPLTVVAENGRKVAVLAK